MIQPKPRWEEEMNLHCTKREVGVSNLVFYAQSTITVISGQERSGKRKLICIMQRENTCADMTGCFVSGAWGRGEPALWRAGHGQESWSTACLPAPDSPCRLWRLPGDRGARCFCSCRNSQREGHPKSVQVSWFTGTAHIWWCVYVCVFITMLCMLVGW